MRPSLRTTAQIFAIGGILTFSASARESAPAKLTLAAATQEALSNNPSITSAWRKWRGMRARIEQETAWDDPRVSYDTTAARFVEMAPNSMADQTLALEQMIPLSGKNVSRGRIATAEAVAVFEEFRRQQLDVSTKLRAAYFQLLNARDQLTLNGRNSTSVQQIASVLRAKYQAGTQLVPDVLAAEIEIAKLDEQRHDLERIQSEAQTKLNVLMNHPAASPIGQLDNTSLPLPRLSERELLTLLLSARPEIRIARARIDAEKARLQLAKRGWIPDPAININAQRYNDASQAVSQLGTGISLSIPWANPGKYSEAVREADENLQAANADLQTVKAEAMGLLHDQLVRIETARHHYELYSGEIEKQAQQAFEASQLNYETGKSSFADWITAQRSMRDVRTVASEMFADYQTAIAELEAIVGVSPATPTATKGGVTHSHSKK